MSLKSIFNNLDKYIIEDQWLTFVGYILAFGGLIGHTHAYGIAVAYVGLGVSMAGWLYKKLYP